MLKLKEYLGKFGTVLVLMVTAFLFTYLWNCVLIFKIFKCWYTCHCIDSGISF